jgi:predicted DNA-binding transcriptional regulator YafY
MQKYIGCIVEIIYLDRKGSFTQRRIRVLNISGGKIKAYCYQSGAPRVFVLDRILAAQPAASVS